MTLLWTLVMTTNVWSVKINLVYLTTLIPMEYYDSYGRPMYFQWNSTVPMGGQCILMEHYGYYGRPMYSNRTLWLLWQAHIFKWNTVVSMGGLCILIKHYGFSERTRYSNGTVDFNGGPCIGMEHYCFDRRTILQ